MKNLLPTRMRKLGILALFIFGSTQLVAQDKAIIEAIVEKANNDSQLELLAHELMDQIGPRLVGTPEMEASHNWVVEKYKSWGIEAENQQWGEWKAWERGISHIDMVSPRVQSLNGMQLAWSPATPKKGITAEAILLPENIKDSLSFARWLPNVKGKLVMVSMLQPTGRPDATWKEYATEESLEKMQNDRRELEKSWRENISRTGYTSRNIQSALEDAGAAGIVSSYWSKEYGSNKIFGASTKKIPVVDLSLEDYGMVYRLVQSGQKPELHIVAQSSGKGSVPTFNSVARIEGTEKPEEYVILSAHLDSWDGGTGATDNGTGTITMMEVARILKEVYPNPKRTIIIGHWGSEEQGLNGSRAFVEDHPEMMKTTQVVFNQDNGTGRVSSINGQGFLHSYDFLGRWLSDTPKEVTQHIETTFPGMPWGGGSDHASFVAAGVPGFMLSSLSWEYGKTTWHTNLDTYDKIVFDDVRNNVILIAALTYLASEDPETTQRDQVSLPMNPRTGKQAEWPTQRSPNRNGGM
ncbi:MAG TPA: M20/M25/M40 family metallo-hydrolase [Flavobacteriaceae bacterium]|nr:M20/M25/M40 family metallo-hydrolase [Flavobacteriaceae bacterium]